jgi:5-methylthioribose kinase
MLEITVENAAEYLHSTGRAHRGEPIEARELAGGVSNAVLLITLPNCGQRFVVKQARERLRVKDEWLCPVERIWREVETLRACQRLLGVRSAECGVRNDEPIQVEVPRVLWEDQDNFVYAMSAAPEEHCTWKDILLAGEIARSSDLAVACGRMLGRLHARSWGNREIATALDDRAYFERLRLDPYYRQIARVHVDLAPAIEHLIDSVWRNRCSLVHGDFSPKNLLVWPGHVMLIDFEVGHFGDPAFDLGFFLTHLVLKSVWAGERGGAYLEIADQFWQSYMPPVRSTIGAAEWTALEQRAMWSLAGCMLARVDGKSRVEYLSAGQQQPVRKLSCEWLLRPPESWNEALAAMNT